LMHPVLINMCLRTPCGGNTPSIEAVIHVKVKMGSSADYWIGKSLTRDGAMSTTIVWSTSIEVDV